MRNWNWKDTRTVTIRRYVLSGSQEVLRHLQVERRLELGVVKEGWYDGVEGREMKSRTRVRLRRGGETRARVRVWP